MGRTKSPSMKTFRRHLRVAAADGVLGDFWHDPGEV